MTPPHEGGPAPALRVATYNLHDLADDRLALRTVLRALGAAGVDVLCVQELPRHPAGPARLAALARPAGFVVPASHALGGGTTVLTGPRAQRVRLRHVPLAVPVGQRRRGVAVLDAVVAGTPVRAVSLHLGLHEVQRRRHADRLLTSPGLVDGSVRTVVAGDANETLDGPAVRLLRRELAPLGSAPATYPADAPRAAIDVVLGSGWSASREIDLDLDDRLMARASDHRPRVVEVET